MPSAILSPHLPAELAQVAQSCMMKGFLGVGNRTHSATCSLGILSLPQAPSASLSPFLRPRHSAKVHLLNKSQNLAVTSYTIDTRVLTSRLRMEHSFLESAMFKNPNWPTLGPLSAGASLAPSCSEASLHMKLAPPKKRHPYLVHSSGSYPPTHLLPGPEQQGEQSRGKQSSNYVYLW